MELDSKEMALTHQGHARHYTFWQMVYRDKNMLGMAVRMQQDAASASSIARYYLTLLLDMQEF